ncbi:ThiF family adenylyltransferase [Prevotella sp. KH2C16]|uniref:tRNA threonylcarbamoyladenosine dehydratase n=1 Tax=Prevotella sp. KH2C16 TaxID=1855325 RepID=UPI0008F24110|nr:tRNA threonylcarbamoyladenosine dehydratase [Prevotella sp. KH2C16]SFG21803.1 tRNA A37 threonylcarbamoyladenosine dehydratase [Prevotella sp. KH2C16]
MQNQFSRTQLLLGKPAMETLAASRVAVFGIGGVGGHALEVLARSGVGSIDVFDNDRVCLTNVNRQILALLSTVGQYKVEVAEARIHDINPDCRVGKHPMFYLPENAGEVDLSQFDYVVDCIDTITAKIELARRCYGLGVPLISSMGAANKLDPTAFRVADIYETNRDPLAKVMRKKLRKLGVPHLKVVYSEEEPLKPLIEDGATEEIQDNGSMRRSIPASNAFVPAAAGLIIGGEVVKDLIRKAGTLRTESTGGENLPVNR